MDSTPMHIRIQIRISQQPYSGGGALQLEHEFPLQSLSLGQIAQILQRYDDLSKTIESENKIGARK